MQSGIPESEPTARVQYPQSPQSIQPSKDYHPEVVYANPPRSPWHGIISYVAIASLLVIASLFLIWNQIGTQYVWIQKWYLLAFSLMGPAIYLAWIYRKDKYEPEPIYLVILLIGWGTFAGFLSFLGNTYSDELGLGMLASPIIGAPIIEESMKGIGVYLMSKKPEFNDSLDGIVYGFAAGTGFAWVENFLYVVRIYEGDLLLSVLRVFLFSYGHGLYTAFTGRALGEAKVKKGFTQRSDLLRGLIPAMFMHGLYNSFLIGILELGEIESWLIWPLLVFGLFTLILYREIRKAQKQEQLWGYDQGYAPIGQS